MKKIFMITTLCSLMGLSACGQKTFDEELKSLYRNTVPTISPNQLLQLQTSSNEYVILDIRSPKEYKVSHIDDAIFVDYDKFKLKDINDIPKDKKVIVYCSVGYRSERVGEKLLKAGYEDVNNLYGGIFLWKNENHDVLNERNHPTDSVHTYNKSWSKWLMKGVKVYE